MMATVVAPRCRCGHTWPEHGAHKPETKQLRCGNCDCRSFIPLRKGGDK